MYSSVRRATLLSCFASVFMTACNESDPPSGPNQPDTPSQASSGALQLQRTLDDEFLELARTVPGFGGLFFDDAGTAHVYLTNTQAVAAAVPAVAAYLRARVSPEPTIQIRQGQFDYAELNRAYRALLAAISSRDVTLRDIDEARNRVVLGVMNSAAADRIAAELERTQGLPPNVVEVRVIPPTVAQFTTLRQVVSPRIGGLLIRNSAGQECTLGFNAIMGMPLAQDPNGYFITNSHCTGEVGVMGGLSFGQPDLGQPIGVEAIDPPTFTSAENADCPVGRNCRYSDAALIRYNSGVAFNRGQVARTLNEGSISIIGIYRVRVAGTQAFLGQVVRKVGQITGFTTGTVRTTCATISVFEPDPFVPGGVRDTGRDLLCQWRADYNSDQGDSGSPVIALQGGDDIDLEGVHWGRSIEGGSFSVFNFVDYEIRNTYNSLNGTEYSLVALHP